MEHNNRSQHVKHEPEQNTEFTSGLGTSKARKPTSKVKKMHSDQVLYGADDGNRTRVLSLGSASTLIASCLRMACFAWSRPVLERAVVVRCCAALHRVVRSSRYGLGTPTVCSFRDAAESIFWLFWPLSDYVTGQTLVVGGGAKGGMSRRPTTQR